MLATGTFLTWVRWWWLGRALGVPWRLADGVRLGLLGYVCNLLPLGTVGGDILKAVLLAHEQKSRQAEAVASVVVDRVIGLYVLFVYATTAILLTRAWQTNLAEVRGICIATFSIAAAGTVGIAIVLGFSAVRTMGHWAASRIPRLGPKLQSLLDAMWMYRGKLPALGVAALVTVGVHTCSVVGCYLIARGLPGVVPSLGTHFVVIPLAIVGGVVPLPAGPFEFIIEFLYTHLFAAGRIATGQGLVVALAYRLCSILTAALGLVYYFGYRRELADAIHDVEDQQ